MTVASVVLCLLLLLRSMPIGALLYRAVCWSILFLKFDIALSLYSISYTYELPQVHSISFLSFFLFLSYIRKRIGLDLANICCTADGGDTKRDKPGEFKTRSNGVDGNARFRGAAVRVATYASATVTRSAAIDTNSEIDLLRIVSRLEKLRDV